MLSEEFWLEKRVFVTGCTGFKGSWLCMWLARLSAKIEGYALEPPTKPSLFEQIGLQDSIYWHAADIRDRDALRSSIESFRPDIVFHLAAQPLVNKAYLHPDYTFQTNIQGTVNLLDVIRELSEQQADFPTKVIINVSSDKCYRSADLGLGYREEDALGGNDPYSASKACADIVAASYAQTYFANRGLKLCSVRAGNVIGGGDWSDHRLIPDLIGAFTEEAPLQLRNPDGIRPWQHVLDPIHGYLYLAQLLYSNDQMDYMDMRACNLGPAYEDQISVLELTRAAARYLNNRFRRELELQTVVKSRMDFPETKVLHLDSTKAMQELAWHPRWTFPRSLDETMAWYSAWLEGRNMRTFTIEQIESFYRNTS